MATVNPNRMFLEGTGYPRNNPFGGYGVSAVIARGEEEESWNWKRGEGIVMLGIITKNVKGIKKPFMRFESKASDTPFLVMDEVEVMNRARSRSVGGVVHPEFFKKAIIVDNTYEVDGEVILERQYWQKPKNTHNLIGWSNAKGTSMRYEEVEAYYPVEFNEREVIGDLLQMNVGLPFDDYIIDVLLKIMKKYEFNREWICGSSSSNMNSAVGLKRSFNKGIAITHWKMTYSYPKLVEMIGQIQAKRYANEAKRKKKNISADA